MFIAKTERQEVQDIFTEMAKQFGLEVTVFVCEWFDAGYAWLDTK